MLRTPQLPLFQNAPSPYLIACRIHSSVPARGPDAAPSEFPVYGLEFGMLGSAGSTAIGRLSFEAVSGDKSRECSGHKHCQGGQEIYELRVVG